MAARYLTVTYVTNQVGKDFLFSALDADSTTSTTFASVSAPFYGVVESSSAIVGTYMRKMGYSVPATSTSAEDVKAITFAVLYETLYARPEVMVPLPDTWAGHPSKLLYEELKTGDAHLSVSGSTEEAIGGFKMSKSATTDSTADGGRRGVFTRKNMAGI